MSISLNKILDAAEKEEEIELKVFKNAIIKTLQAYQENPTKANQQNYEAACKACKAERARELREIQNRGV
jgi:hypothetical protein